MSDSNALKGIGVAALFGVLALRNCDTCGRASKSIVTHVDEVPITLIKEADDIAPSPGPVINDASKSADPSPGTPPFSRLDDFDTRAKLTDGILKEDIFSKSHTSEERSVVAQELENRVNARYNYLYNNAKPDNSVFASLGPTKKDYAKKYEEYKAVKDRLVAMFAADDVLFLNYLKNSLEIFDSPFPLLGAEKFKDIIVPHYLIEPGDKINMHGYYLFTGSKLSGEQGAVLTDITGNSITNDLRNFDRTIVVEKRNGEYLIRTLEGEKTAANLKESLGNISNQESKFILVKGEWSEELLVWLRSNKVSIAADATRYFDLINLERKPIRTFVISSDDDEVLMDLYSINKDQVKDMRRSLDFISSTENTEIVKSQEELEQKLSEAYSSDESSIVIFNNSDQTIFGKPIDHYSYLDGVLTCNSYSLENTDFAFNSVDYLYIKETFAAYRRIQSTNPRRLDEFYGSFARSYRREIVATQRERIVSFVLLGVGGVGVVSGAIYLGSNNK